jgi:hypothetical protein
MKTAITLTQIINYNFSPAVRNECSLNHGNLISLGKDSGVGSPMRNKTQLPLNGTPSYWKARLTSGTASDKSTKNSWAYVQSTSINEIRFHCEKMLKPGTPVTLDIQAIHKGVKHPLHLTGKVLSCILLSCGTLYGIDLQITSISKADHKFIAQYIEDKKTMKLTYSSF